VKVNGLSEGIQTILVSNTGNYWPTSRRRISKGAAIYPVTVENPVPANVESNIQLLAVYFAPPSVETVLTEFHACPARAGRQDPSISRSLVMASGAVRLFLFNGEAAC